MLVEHEQQPHGESVVPASPNSVGRSDRLSEALSELGDGAYRYISNGTHFLERASPPSAIAPAVLTQSATIPVFSTDPPRANAVAELLLKPP